MTGPFPLPYSREPAGLGDERYKPMYEVTKRLRDAGGCVVLGCQTWAWWDREQEVLVVQHQAANGDELRATWPSKDVHEMSGGEPVAGLAAATGQIDEAEAWLRDVHRGKKQWGGMLDNPMEPRSPPEPSDTANAPPTG